MALKWIFGNWKNGTVSLNNTLPVIQNSDDVTVDINAGDTATLALSKRNIQADWRSIVRENATMFALVEDSLSWNAANSVLFAGMVNKVDGRIGETIKVQVTGYREYLSARIVTGGLLNVKSNQPKNGLVFNGPDWQGVFCSVIKSAVFHREAAQVLGTIQGSDIGSTVQYGVLTSDGQIYSELLDALRDTESPNANEYRFKPRWSDSSRTRIVFDALIGTDAQPQLNWNDTAISIPLSKDSPVRNIGYGLSINSETRANRLIAISKAGDLETNTGSDYQTRYIDNGLPLMDAFFNPGVELTEAQMDAQVTSRLEDISKPKGSAEYEVADSPAMWINNLGKKIIFTGEAGTDSDGYSETVRITGIHFSSSNQKIKVDVMLPQAKYPTLPSTKNSLGIIRGGGAGSNQPGGNANQPIGGGMPPENYTPPTYVPPGDIVVPETPIPVDEFNAYKLSYGGWAYDIFANVKSSTYSGHTLAISADGELFAWGRNNFGQCGTGNLVDVKVPTKIGTAKNWKHVFASANKSFALTNEGALFAWGRNRAQEPLGVGQTQANITAPRQIASNVKYFNCNNAWTYFYIDTSNRMFAFGRNNLGQCGVGSIPITSHVTTPEIIRENGVNTLWNQIAVDTSGMAATSQQATTNPSTPNYGENDAGVARAGFTVLNSSTVWGLRDTGQVAWWGIYQPAGMNMYSNIPTNVPGDDRFKVIAVLNRFTAVGITTKNELKIITRTGVTTTIDTDVYGLPHVNEQNSFITGIGGGGALNAYMVYYVKNDGTLWFYGNNIYGRSGTGDGISSTVDASIIQKQITTAKNLKDCFWRIGAGANFIINRDGEFFVWGLNHQGQLGIGNTNSQDKPVQIGTGTNYVRVSPGMNFSSGGVKRDKQIITGINYFYQLGNNVTESKISWDRQDGLALVP